MENGKVIEATIEEYDSRDYHETIEEVLHATIEYDFTDLKMPSLEGYTLAK